MTGVQTCALPIYFLDPRAVERLFDEGRGMKLWYLFNFALWWKQYIAGGVSTPLRSAA